VPDLDETRCPLCKTECTWDHGVYMNDPFCPKIACLRCGSYIANKRQLSDFISKRAQDAVRLAVLLFERRVSRRPSLPWFLVFAADDPSRPCLNSQCEPHADPVRADDLLRQCPTYGHEQLDRALLQLTKLAPTAGQRLDCERHPAGAALWFAEDEVQAVWIQKALAEDCKWIESSSNLPAKKIQILPKGWKRVEELTRTRSALTNPAFVARWFGTPKKDDKDALDRTEEMARLVDEGIYPAIHASGYTATKADTDDYNTGIMDKVHFGIRRAPFVVADFTNHNQGVYYEAGLALGLGIDVIHCCPGPEFEKAHFDIRHVNHIVYTSPEDLRRKLKGRILRFRGQGPFPPRGGGTSD